MADTMFHRVGALAPHARRRLRFGKQQLRWLLSVLGPLLVLVGAAYFYATGGRYITTDDAYVHAETVNLSTDVSGIVSAVLVRDNERVAKGQPLFRLDDEPFRIALQNAEAQLGVVRGDIEALKASYRQTEADIATAEADVAFYRRQFARKQTLLGQSFASQESVDQARHNFDNAEGRLAQLRQKLAGILAKLDGNPNISVERHPRYLAAEAAVNQAERNRRDTVVRAPFAGVVTNVSQLTRGSYLAAGATGFNLVATDHVWVEADPKETKLTYARPGQPVTVTVDTYPGVEWHGTLESISPASASSFSLLPAQNTSGNWVKVVRRIPVRIRVKIAPGQPVLRDGMSVEVAIDTHHHRRLPQFVEALFGLG